ncbi:active regulator of SIRT1-like, partial [Scleropages formosus]
MDQISSNKQGVTKQIRRLRGQRGLARPQASVKDKRIKSAVEEFRKRQKKSCLKQNLQYFLGTKCKADQKDTSKIQFQNCGRQSRNKPDHHVKKPMEPKSLFTEEEFEQFQKDLSDSSKHSMAPICPAMAYLRAKNIISLRVTCTRQAAKASDCWVRSISSSSSTNHGSAYTLAAAQRRAAARSSWALSTLAAAVGDRTTGMDVEAGRESVQDIMRFLNCSDTQFSWPDAALTMW